MLDELVAAVTELLSLAATNGVFPEPCGSPGEILRHEGAVILQAPERSTSFRLRLLEDATAFDSPGLGVPAHWLSPFALDLVRIGGTALAQGSHLFRLENVSELAGLTQMTSGDFLLGSFQGPAGQIARKGRFTRLGPASIAAPELVFRALALVTQQHYLPQIAASLRALEMLASEINDQTLDERLGPVVALEHEIRRLRRFLESDLLRDSDFVALDEVNRDVATLHRAQRQWLARFVNEVVEREGGRELPPGRVVRRYRAGWDIQRNVLALLGATLAHVSALNLQTLFAKTENGRRAEVYGEELHDVLTEARDDIALLAAALHAFTDVEPGRRLGPLGSDPGERLLLRARCELLADAARRCLHLLPDATLLSRATLEFEMSSDAGGEPVVERASLVPPETSPQPVWVMDDLGVAEVFAAHKSDRIETD